MANFILFYGICASFLVFERCYDQVYSRPKAKPHETPRSHSPDQPQRRLPVPLHETPDAAPAPPRSAQPHST
jgi:hypothetical protein